MSLTIAGFPRIKLWIACLLCIIVILVSSIEDRSIDTFTSGQKRNKTSILVLSVTSFVVALGAVLVHLHPLSASLLVGQKTEGIIIFFLLAFCSAIVAASSSATNGTSTDSDGSVVFGNLYYFSWIGLMVDVVLMSSFLQNVYELDITNAMKSRSHRLPMWSLFIMSSIVVIGSSAEVHQDKCTSDKKQPFCHRTTLCVIIATLNALVGFVTVGLKVRSSGMPFLTEAGACCVLFLLNAFGVAYTTSAQGPGSALGNIYFFSWTCFVLAFLLTSSCYEDYQAALIDEATAKNDEINVAKENTVNKNVEEIGLELGTEETNEKADSVNNTSNVIMTSVESDEMDI